MLLIPSEGNCRVSTILPTPRLRRVSSGLENPVTARRGAVRQFPSSRTGCTGAQATAALPHSQTPPAWVTRRLSKPPEFTRFSNPPLWPGQAGKGECSAPPTTRRAPHLGFFWPATDRAVKIPNIPCTALCISVLTWLEVELFPKQVFQACI